jgi:hypothetical protein
MVRLEEKRAVRTQDDDRKGNGKTYAKQQQFIMQNALLITFILLPVIAELGACKVCESAA